MSTFNGYIKEYPILAIDRFIPNGIAKFFILSHVHKDHTHGLENRVFKEKIYCTEQTALLLPLLETRTSNLLMYKHLKNYVVPVPYNETMVLEFEPNCLIKITFLPANHCPGAALVLIEGENGTVLYTGDMRAEPQFVEENLDCLKTFRIKNLYMDTTCCYADRRNFISKVASIQLLIELIKSYPNDCHFYLDCWTVGYEELWMAVTEYFGEKIHVSQQRYTMYCHLNSLFENVLTTEATSRFHSCRWDKECSVHEEYMISIHPTPNKNCKPFQYFRSKHSRQLLATDLPWNCKPFKQMILPFSTHSSLSEIVFFHRFINPKEFTPCVVHGKWETLEQMRLLLIEEGCKLNTAPSSSDIERENATNSLQRNLLSSAEQQSSTDQSIKYFSTIDSDSQQSAKKSSIDQEKTNMHYVDDSVQIENFEDSIVPSLSLCKHTLSLDESKPCQGLFITEKNTRLFIKSVKEMQKRRRKTKIGSKCNPVCL